jgi:hypothetical protein
MPHEDVDYRRRVYPSGPWDFVRSFPSPLPGVVASGRLHAGDGVALTVTEIESIHSKLIREGVERLQQIAELNRRRREGLHPTSGKQIAKRHRSKVLAEYPDRLRTAWRAFALAFSDYDGSFGVEAGRALRRFCVAVVEGVMLVTIRADELRLPRPLADTNASKRRRVRAFDAQCPVIWTPMVRVWNLDRLGPYPAASTRKPGDYDPGQPFYYQRAGRPIGTVQMEADAKLIRDDDKLAREFRTRSRSPIDWQSLARTHRIELDAIESRYLALVDEGPLALPDESKALNTGATPIAVWAEALAMLYRQLARRYAVQKALDERSRTQPKRDVQLLLF